RAAGRVSAHNAAIPATYAAAVADPLHEVYSWGLGTLERNPTPGATRSIVAPRGPELLGVAGGRSSRRPIAPTPSTEGQHAAFPTNPTSAGRRALSPPPAMSKPPWASIRAANISQTRSGTGPPHPRGTRITRQPLATAQSRAAKMAIWEPVP